MNRSILVIDDDISVQELLNSFLKKNSFEVLISGDWSSAKSSFYKYPIDIVLLDLNLPGKNGIEILKEIKTSFNSEVIIFSGRKDIELAVEAIKLGAFDYVEKTDSLEKILKVINNAIKLKTLEEENTLLKNITPSLKYIKGVSEVSENIDKIIKIAAKTDANVLITGENGTGKQVVAETIHRLSSNKNSPFVDINCAAIPENLIESELFGYKKGAFTGAYKDTKGKFDIADGGTIFLDEITEIPVNLQAKLLKVIENKKFTPLGSNEEKRLNARIIAATNKNLEEEIAKGSFRQDLFYRLNVIHISLPPLRERKEDIPFFLNHFVKEIGKNVTFTQDAIDLLIDYDWPGNIRELKNIVERSIIMAESKQINKDDIIKYLKTNKRLTLNNYEIIPLKKYLESKEKEYLLYVLSKCKSKKDVSKLLKIERTCLYRKLRKYNIDS